MTVRSKAGFASGLSESGSDPCYLGHMNSWSHSAGDSYSEDIVWILWRVLNAESEYRPSRAWSLIAMAFAAENHIPTFEEKFWNATGSLVRLNEWPWTFIDKQTDTLVRSRMLMDPPNHKVQQISNISPDSQEWPWAGTDLKSQTVSQALQQ